MTLETDRRLADRYGSGSSASRWVVGGLAAAVVVGLALLLVTIISDQTRPKVTSGLVSFEVLDDHSVTTRMDVDLADGVEATCLLRAYAEDHTPVGDLSFTPIDGGQSVTIRTERRATSVEKIGCTAPGQNSPR
ncbi:MAG: DUF4307 domain-containing protein [Nocardioides sp.]